MMKMFVLIPKKPEISNESFHSHWRTTHASLALLIPTLKRYSQSHRDSELTADLAHPPFAAAPYLGVSEAWFPSREAALGMAHSTEYRTGARQDEDNFMDVEHKARLFTSEVSASAGQPDPDSNGSLKVLLFTAVDNAIDGKKSTRYFTGEHAALIAALPHLSGHIQRPVEAQHGNASLPSWSFVDEIWWQNEEELCDAWRSKEAAQLHAKARPLISAGSAAIVVRENSVIREP
ncbi:EthD domain-containing protein [Pseudarthrobacter sulfonivorans]|uniref:EthD domain-containing protein n=1 Tax=Pseudarthrobacter sulfonivorans TaxID=121292 RepID=UPI00278227BD|nr:EthD domain-containing protein [Pseudarthrobacter sulfonivorans]MDP9998415.1 uncharacterized protein (TIGR02118 family) [Pseudarthrobacter sulfonivorans]